MERDPRKGPSPLRRSARRTEQFVHLLVGGELDTARLAGSWRPLAALLGALALQQRHDASQRQQQHPHDGDAVVDTCRSRDVERNRVTDDLVGASAPLLGVEEDADDDHRHAERAEGDVVLVLCDLHDRDDERHDEENRDDGHDGHNRLSPVS